MERPGLKQLLALHSQGIQIVVVEMPVQPLHMQVFSEGQVSYNLFVKAVSETTQDQGIGFWRMSEQDPIPPDGWWNLNHLNVVGAKVFSQWLGKRVARFAAENPTTFVTH